VLHAQRDAEDRVCSVFAYTNASWLLKELIPGCSSDLMDEYLFIRVFPGQDCALLFAKKRKYRFRDDVRMNRALLAFRYDTLIVFI